MKYQKTLLAAGIAASVWLSPAMARSNFDVELNVGPPAAVVETVPAPRAGYVWAPGYWDYRGSKHVWQKGHWEHDRHGQHWAAGGWTQNGDKWQLNRGHWEHG